MITKVGEYWRKSWDVYDCCPFTDSYISIGLVVKNLPASARDTGDVGLIPGSGRSSGGGNGNPLQYSRLENPMDGRDWQATVHAVTESKKTE